MTHSIPVSLVLRARSLARRIAKTVSRTPAWLRLDRRRKLYVKSPASGGTGSSRVSQRHRNGLPSSAVKLLIGSDVTFGKASLEIHSECR
jgi:hypothetical protein